MNATTIVARDESFEGLLVEGLNPPTIRLSGTLSGPAPELLLGPFFERLHHYLGTLPEPVVHVDLSGMVFMNSASFKTLLTWVTLMQRSPGATSYRLTFFVDKKRRWQSTSVHALRCFAPELIEMKDAA